jgi:hypothetical protein
LWTVIVTGMLNVAPWHALSDAVLIEAAPLRWTRDDPAARVMFGFDGGLNVTPVVVQPECEASALIVPFPLML